MTEFILDFEKPIVELEKKIKEMKVYALEENVELTEEIRRLEIRKGGLTVTDVFEGRESILTGISHRAGATR